MKGKSEKVILILIISAIACWAQGPRGRQNGGGGGNQNGRLPDMGRLQVVEGPVTAVNIFYGVRYPSIEVNSTSIRVAPAWFLLENDFEISVGDVVKATAAPCNQYLTAVELLNTSRNLAIALRDSSGIPLWSGTGSRRASGQPANARSGGMCLEPSTVATVTGTLDDVSYGPGIEMPKLTLTTSDGKSITIKIGPERILLASDFELKSGDTLTVRVAHSTCADEYIALQLTNSAGVTLTLREDDGRPAWN